MIDFKRGKGGGEEMDQMFKIDGNQTLYLHIVCLHSIGPKSSSRSEDMDLAITL